MKNRRIKNNLFLMLLGTAVKGAASCLFALLLLSIIENVNARKKVSEKKKLFSAVAKTPSSIEEKTAKWR